MAMKQGIYVAIMIFVGNVRDTWGTNKCSTNGKYQFGTELKVIEYTGDGDCLWEVPEEAFNMGYAIAIVIDNINFTFPTNTCVSPLLTGDESNGTCLDMEHVCLAYMKGNLCKQNKIMEKIQSGMSECINVTFLHTSVNIIRLQYRVLSSNTSEHLPSFRLTYKQIKCENVSKNEVTTGFERKHTVEKGNSGKDEDKSSFPEKHDGMSTEQVVITILAATIGTATVVLIALTIIKRQQIRKKERNTIELNDAAKDGVNSKGDLYSPNSYLTVPAETDQQEHVTEVDMMNPSPYYQM